MGIGQVLQEGFRRGQAYQFYDHRKVCRAPVSQAHRIKKQLDEIQDQYETAQRDADLYAADRLNVDDVSSLDRIAQRLYGISYDALVQQRNTNQAIIDEYHQLYSDTYNELNSVEEESTNIIIHNNCQY